MPSIFEEFNISIIFRVNSFELKLFFLESINIYKNFLKKLTFDKKTPS